MKSFPVEAVMFLVLALLSFGAHIVATFVLLCLAFARASGWIADEYRRSIAVGGEIPVWLDVLEMIRCGLAHEEKTEPVRH